MVLRVYKKIRICIVFLSLLLMISTVQIAPILKDVQITQEASAVSTWKDDTESDFNKGELHTVMIKGTGSSAYITLPVGQVKEVMTTKSQYTWGGYRDVFYTGDYNGRCQSVYLASDLKADGFTSGHIQGLELYCYQKHGRPSLKDFRIRMQNTAQTTSTSWITTGWTLVFGPTDVVLTANSWYSFAFTTTFYWDGTSNLLIDFSRDDNTPSYAGAMYVRGSLSNYQTCSGSDDWSSWPFDSMSYSRYTQVPCLKLNTRAESGTFESDVYYSDNDVNWKTISWNSETPTDTDVNFQIRSSDDEYDIDYNDFVGPDGMSDSYYTSSGQAIFADHDQHKYIQYKAYLTSSNPTKAPKLREVLIQYNCLPYAPTLNGPSIDEWMNTNKPTFSWFFNDLDSSTQNSFQWQCDEDENFTAMSYDSGKINSNLFSYTPVISIPDGVNYWRLRTKDSDGDWGPYSAPRRVKIDTTINSPIGLSITPDNWTAEDSFLVDWTNPFDSAGVRTGAYYYIGKSPPTDQTMGRWEDTKPFIISKAPVGANNIYVWLEDVIGNLDYTNYAIAKIKLDRIVPQPPIGISVTPNNWTSIKSFKVDWTDPFDDSGVRAGAYYYIGETSPASQKYGTWMSGKPITITNAPEGESNIYLWLEDNLGNSNYLNYNTSTLKLDTTPPSMSHVKIDSGIHSREITFTAMVSDDSSGVNDVILYFKRPADLTYAKIPLMKSVTYYTAKLPGSVVTQDGIEYYFEATDNAEPSNHIYYGYNGETEFEPNALTDIDISISSLPAVMGYNPKGTNALAGGNITITFNKSMELVTTENAFSISPEKEGVFTWDGDTTILTFAPKEPLPYNTTYIITISNSARDTEGLNIEDDFQWIFTTEVEPVKQKDNTGSGGSGKSDQTDDSMFYSLIIFGIIIVIVLLIIILAIFLNMKRKRDSAEQEQLIEQMNAQLMLQQQQSGTVPGLYGAPGVPAQAQYGAAQIPVPSSSPYPTQQVQQVQQVQQAQPPMAQAQAQVQQQPQSAPQTTYLYPNQPQQQAQAQAPAQTQAPAQAPANTAPPSAMPAPAPAQTSTPLLTPGYTCIQCGANMGAQTSCPYCGWNSQ